MKPLYRVYYKYTHFLEEFYSTVQKVPELP